MFLQRQLFFYEFYFTLVDFLKITVLTYVAPQRVFKLKSQHKWNKLTHLLLLSNFVYLIRGTYLFAKLCAQKPAGSIYILNMSIHTLGLVVLWCSFIYRYMYTIQAPFLIELMNSMLKLESSHLQSKFYCNLINVAQKSINFYYVLAEIKYTHRPTLLLSQSVLVIPLFCACVCPFVCCSMCFFNVWMLPLRSLDDLIFLLGEPSSSFLKNVCSSIVDFFQTGLSFFLASTFGTGFSGIGFLFVIDGLHKLRL